MQLGLIFHFVYILYLSQSFSLLRHDANELEGCNGNIKNTLARNDIVLICSDAL